MHNEERKQRVKEIPAWKDMMKGIGGLSGPQPPCWRNQYQTPHVDKISNAAGLG
jgi:hypothetical protein